MRVINSSCELLVWDADQKLLEGRTLVYDGTYVYVVLTDCLITVGHYLGLEDTKGFDYRKSREMRCAGREAYFYLPGGRKVHVGTFRTVGEATKARNEAQREFWRSAK